MSVIKTLCSICGREISKSNIGRHEKSHEKDKYKKVAYKLDHEDFNCKFCNKICLNRNSLIQHEIRCPSNVNRINLSGCINLDHREA